MLAAKHGKSCLGRPFDDPKERACRTARRALALLPVAHRFNRHADLGGERYLRQPGSSTDVAGISGINETIGTIGARCGLVVGKRHGLLAAVGQDFDQTAVGF
jgi:hypothetical protein